SHTIPAHNVFLCLWASAQITPAVVAGGGQQPGLECDMYGGTAVHARAFIDAPAATQAGPRARLTWQRCLPRYARARRTVVGKSPDLGTPPAGNSGIARISRAGRRGSCDQHVLCNDITVHLTPAHRLFSPPSVANQSPFRCMADVVRCWPARCWLATPESGQTASRNPRQLH
ncbi:hypothetical protein H4S02_013269, partial [Coemansia sp. RSA 2611]